MSIAQPIMTPSNITLSDIKSISAILGFPYMTTANRIKSLRENAKMTQVALATTAGISQVYISQIEAGHKTPSLRVIKAMARALKVQPSHLIDAG